VVIPFLISALMSLLVAVGGLFLPANAWGANDIELERILDWSALDILPDIAFALELDLDSSGSDGGDVGAKGGISAGENGAALTYTMVRGDGTVWGELTGVFGMENYEAIRAANADIPEKEWRALAVGVEIQLPEGMD